MRDGERQVAPDLSGIRRDHVARYEWAAEQIKPRSRVIDVACGVGYGPLVLAKAGHYVTAIDRDPEAIAYAKANYAHHSIKYLVGDANALGNLGMFDVAVSFETIEHLKHPHLLLNSLRCAPLLLASVPDETHFPFRNYKFHERHYTRSEFVELLGASGFKTISIHGQVGPRSKVGKRAGRTLVVMARRAVQSVEVTVKERKCKSSGPNTVAILGLGLTLRAYVNIAKGQGARKKLCDEVWGINSLGDVLACDRVFHMDDVRIQEIRAAADPDGNIAAMLGWLKKHPGPIYTSRKHPDYPGLVAYPVADVLNSCAGQRYFNSTAAWAVAYAIHIGVKKIMCFGMDFTLPDQHRAEQGRACVEFWLGFARARGIEIVVPKDSSLLDALVPNEQRLYGYDTVNVKISGEPGKERVRFTPRKTLSTAEEIEARYDHTRHPNHLMRD